MKKLLVLLTIALLVGCTCLGQIPPQTKYVRGDTVTCTAPNFDFMPFVTATAACSEVTQLYQLPAAGVPISEPTITTIFAITDADISSTLDVLVVPYFLDSARITINADAFAYTDQEVFDMFQIAHDWIYNYPTRYMNAIQDSTQLGWMNVYPVYYSGWSDTLWVSRWPIKYEPRIANTESGDLNGDLMFNVMFK